MGGTVGAVSAVVIGKTEREREGRRDVRVRDWGEGGGVDDGDGEGPQRCDSMETMGIEPMTSSMQRKHSPTELRPRFGAEAPRLDVHTRIIMTFITEPYRGIISANIL